MFKGVVKLSVSQTTIQNLVNLVEGKVQIGWSKWWLQHAATLESEFGRADFLKIKFKHCKGASEYLTKLGVPHTLSKRASIIDAEADYHDSMKDEKGNLCKSALNKTWDGAIEQFHNGNTDKSIAIFKNKLALALRSGQHEKLNDLTFDIEKMMASEKEFALACMRVIADIDISKNDLLETYDDLLNDAIDRAREIVSEFE